MDFKLYSQKEVLSDPVLTNYLLDTIIDHLSYIYGNDMGSPEDRREWIAYNLERPEPSWRVTVAHRGGKNLGFLITTLDKRQLVINDVQIERHARKNPFLLLGLFITAFQHYDDKFTTLGGYINKSNNESQNNFLRYATIITELKNGYSFEVDEIVTEQIKKKLEKYHKK